jgi:hypothetical protein
MTPLASKIDESVEPKRQQDGQEQSDVPAGCRRHQIRPKSYDGNSGIRVDVNLVPNT